MLLPGDRNSNMAKFLKQTVTLTELRSTIFNNAISTIQDAHAKLAHCYAPGCLQPWNPDSFQGQCVMDFSNRYLMSRQRIYASPMVPFLPGVDPNNVLTRLAADRYSHLEENRVSYYKLDNKFTK